ncbi:MULTISPECIES: TetR/AcrR family transcriptional regulator [Nannocystis]|uniref:TetR family transcriptional regulator n=1 Tax=Nannocystis radixulma TaxID=2995305 RepID=A0ABT5B3R2_9BACT|nr:MULTISPECIES: TetR/AcrR family transcriptional regulator [Nannocystis]MCY1055875.1 TetR family transcriptional regulator [Nannocystis sp. SCPEA4]MDC0668720.1 TetR family transcriptional regulator [Nannocystis radixulma]
MPRVKEFDPEEALDRALDLFWRRGYEGTSLRDLIEHMDISRQSLYDTFGDKRSLFLKVLARYEKLAFESTYELVTRASWARPIERPLTALVAIRGLFETYLHEVVRATERGSCLMANTAIEVGASDPEIQAVVRAFFVRVEDALHTVLERAHEAGELPATSRDTRALARHLVNTLYGLGIMGRAGASRAALRQMLDVGLSVLA